MFKYIALFLVVALTATSLTYCQTSDQRNIIDLGTCFVHIINDVDVPARESGPIVNFDLKQGDQVAAGQVIAKVSDTAAKLQVSAAKVKHEAAQMTAQSNIANQYADKSYEFAKRKYSKTKRLYDSGASSDAELEEARLASEEAQLRVRKSMQDQQIAIKTASIEKVAIEIAQDNLDLHDIVAPPFDGDVMQVYREKGEWVDKGEKIARIIRMNKLRVNGSVSAVEYNPSEIVDRPVTVVVELARGEKAAFEGRVANVSLDLTAKKRFRVHAEINNRKQKGQWLLRPNAEVKMYIRLN